MEESQTTHELLAAFRSAVRANLALALTASPPAPRVAAVVDALASALAVARDAGLVGKAWLFGSYAWGSPGERSDVDLLVDGCADTADLAARLGKSVPAELHVVATARASTSLVQRVLSQGRPL